MCGLKALQLQFMKLKHYTAEVTVSELFRLCIMLCKLMGIYSNEHYEKNQTSILNKH